MTISGSFTDLNAWAGGIRRAQARAAFDDSDGKDVLNVGEGASLILVTKRVNQPWPHLILLIATLQGDHESVTSGYRLSVSEDELTDLTSNPRRALDELIRRFGRTFSINDGEPTDFVEQAHIDAPELAIKVDDSHVTINSLVRRRPMGGFDVSFVWAIDEDRYRSAWR